MTRRRLERLAMRSATDRDIASLEQKAMRADSGESCLVLSSDAEHRLAVFVTVSPNRSASYGIELVVRVLRGDSEVWTPALARAGRLARKLRRMGYPPVFRGDGWLSAQKAVARKYIDRELQALVNLKEWPDSNRPKAGRGEPEG